MKNLKQQIFYIFLYFLFSEIINPLENNKPKSKKNINAIAVQTENLCQSYEEKDTVNQAKVLLYMLTSDHETVNKTLQKEYQLSDLDIEKFTIKNLPDTFLDYEVEINILKDYMSSMAIKNFKKVVTDARKKNKYNYKCLVCGKPANAHSSQCYCCFYKFHAKCIKKDRRQHEEKWFCKKCINLHEKKIF